MVHNSQHKKRKVKKVRPRNKLNDNRSKEHLKPVFLEQFSKYGTIMATCKVIGISRNTVVKWREVDADFNTAFEEVDSTVTEGIERRAIELATKRDHHIVTVQCNVDKGNPKGHPDCKGQQSITVPCVLGADPAVMIFLLKSRTPRYRPTTTININFMSDFISLVVKAVNETLPSYCPHCTQSLDLRKPIINKLESMKNIAI